ncbi:methyltransferase domain-containing protein [Frankia gtarii]|uniref:methyltransferase domain-containing protein n=1 Tax=Frankia gtarii TaxID=2950102 RepID=UPI0021BF7F66|nr:methyltransferase domain-containing protein [Frankia gtarii]
MATVPNLTAIRADIAGPLPTADRQVDVVVSMNTLECLVDPAAAIVEMARILRPTGMAVRHTPISRRAW